MKKWAFYDKDSACDVFMEINCFQFISKHSTELKWLKDLIRLHFFFCLNCERKKDSRKSWLATVTMSTFNDSSENLFRENACRWVQLSWWFDHKNSLATFQFHFVCVYCGKVECVAKNNFHILVIVHTWLSFSCFSFLKIEDKKIPRMYKSKQGIKKRVWST